MKGTASVMNDESDWQAENDMNTLIQAEKIKADAKRMKAAMKKFREEKAAMNKVSGAAK